jgi:DNA primase
MTSEQILEVMRQIGSESARVSSDGDEVAAGCPFAPFRHDGGSDRRPSFYVKVGNGGASPYICFACHVRGDDLRKITWRLEEEAKAAGRAITEFVLDPEGLRRFMVELALVGNVAKRIGTYDGKESAEAGTDHLAGFEPVGTVSASDQALAYIRDHYDDLFEKAIPRYIFNRGLLQQTAEKWGIRLDRQWNRAALPVRNRAGDLVGVTGRALDPRAEPKYLHYPGLRKSRYLYGENFVDPARGALIVVEGFFDVLLLWQQGYNTVSIMGSFPSRVQVQTAIDLLPPDGKMIVWLDGDSAGLEGMMEFKGKVNGRVPVWGVRVEGKDPKDLSVSEVQEALGGAKLL